MPVHIRGNFSDLLDPRFREISAETIKELLGDDYVPILFGMPGATQPQRDTERYSEVSGLPRAGVFTGSVDYAQFFQGYDTTATYVEIAQGVQIERLLIDYDQKAVIEERPRALAESMFRRRQFDGQRWLRNAFSVDTFFHNRTEGVALCSNSHTTTTGASTAAGFDNLTTSAFSGPALAAAQIQLADFRNLQAEPIQIVGDTIVAPLDIYESVWETVSSMGKVEVANNNRNVHFGAYTIVFLRNKVDFTDVNDWFLVDGRRLKEQVLWFDQVWPGGQPETGFAEEFDTFVGKWRAYARWTNIIRDWRFLLGSQVA